jgi:xylulokinase
MHERPDEYRRIAKFVMPAGYVAGRIAGLGADQAFIDYTFLHFTALADAERGAWSDELCALLGIDRARLPKIVQPWDVVGEVTSDAARDFGLAPGTPVAAGCGDTAAGALGAGVVKPGMLLDTAGTASVLACCTDTYVADRRNRALLTMRSVVPGIWNPLAYIGGGGLAVRWFRDQFFSPDGTAADAGDPYERMFQMAAGAPPACDGLLFSPHLGGRICPAAPEMRGAWIGFSWGHTQAHLFRSILESVGYEYAYYLSILRGLLPDLRFVEARVIGGGAQSPVWNQMKSDILRVPYRRVLRSESATWGCALIAGVASGLIADLAEAALATAPVAHESAQPDTRTSAVYAGAIERYLSWQRRLQDGFKIDAW